MDIKALGRLIERLRVEADLTRGQLRWRANKLEGRKLSPSHIGKLERGEISNPGVETLDIVARAMGVDLVSLLRALRSDDEERPEQFDPRVVPSREILEGLLQPIGSLEIADPVGTLHEWASLSPVEQDVIADLIHTRAAKNRKAKPGKPGKTSVGARGRLKLQE